MRENILRLTKAQLDGACDNPAFPPDFFLELIFEPLPHNTAATSDATAAHSSAPAPPRTGSPEPQHAWAAEPDALLADSSMFWDEVAKRKVRVSVRPDVHTHPPARAPSPA